MIRIPLDGNPSNIAEKNIAYLAEYAGILLAKKHIDKPHDVLKCAIIKMENRHISVNPALKAVVYYLFGIKQANANEIEYSIEMLTKSINLYPTREAHKLRHQQLQKRLESIRILHYRLKQLPEKDQAEVDKIWKLLKIDQSAEINVDPIPPCYPPPPRIEA